MARAMARAGTRLGLRVELARLVVDLRRKGAEIVLGLDHLGLRRAPQLRRAQTHAGTRRPRRHRQDIDKCARTRTHARPRGGGWSACRMHEGTQGRRTEPLGPRWTRLEARASTHVEGAKGSCARS
eukprot:3509454-Pleurochrysis_carterae.AAC.1